MHAGNDLERAGFGPRAMSIRLSCHASYVITKNVLIGNRPGAGHVEPPMAPQHALAAPSRSRVTPDPLMVGLSTVNWLFLMVLLSALMLAATMSDRSEPAGTSTQIGATTTR